MAASETPSVSKSPFDGTPGTSDAAGGSWGNSGGSSPHSELVERIEFGLVPLDRHPDAVASLQSLVEQLEVAERQRDSLKREADMYRADRDEYDAILGRKMDALNDLREQLEAAQEQLAAPRDVTALRVGIDWHSHDGMVTVYDRDGRYMGCMGVERFHRLLAEDAISRGSNPASRPDVSKEGEDA